jgi:AcrR family transcriptional regulator
MVPKSTLPELDELRASLRRKDILEAAKTVFAEKGYHYATTKDIARQAGLAEGTLYLYFKSKAELLMGLLSYLDETTTQPADLSAGLELSLRELLSSRLEQDLAQLGPTFDLLLATLPEVLANPALRAQYYQRLIEPGQQGLIAHLQARQERGEIQGKDIPMAVRIFMATILGMEVMHLLGDEAIRAAWQHPDTLAESIAQILLDGLQPKAG